MNGMNIYLGLVFLILISCEFKNEDYTSKIENSLGVNFNYSVNDIQYYKKKLDQDYLFPYNEYITFKSDFETFQNIAEGLNLISSDSNKADSLLCLKRKGDFGFFNSNFKLIKSINHPADVVSKTEKKISWWTPKYNTIENTYVGYYNDSIESRIVSCMEDWKGRIVIQYNEGNVFILIERFASRN